MIKFAILFLCLGSSVLLYSFGVMAHDHNKKMNLENIKSIQEIKETNKVVKKRKQDKVKVKKQKIKAAELQCLTDNVYYEAKHEPALGKRAVAMVTINRTKHAAYPDSICKVVYQRNKKTCQFSWVCGANKAYNHKEYMESKKIAEAVYHNPKRIFKTPVLHFHADYVKPKWADHKYLAGKIGRHLFYVGVKRA